jgi:enoyl-CoA hydratase
MSDQTSSKEYKNIIVQQEGKAGIIELNRPKALNALNSELLSELIEALQVFDAAGDVGCMVLTGNQKAFSAGADIKEMAGATAVSMLNTGLVGYFDQLTAIRKPIIAAVSGWCLGGGCEVALACDMIVASESAKFGQPEINIGVIPGAGGTQRLAHAIGKAVAMEMVINNRNLTAQEALAYGLVNRVAPVEGYLDEAIKLANEIGARAPVAAQLGKEAVNKAFELSLSEGLHLERQFFAMLFATEDQKEGMAAFVEKRSAEWKGR